MDMVNIHAAKTQFSRLVERAEKGETILVARNGKPVARLAPVEDEVEAPKTARRFGILQGEFTVSDDIKAFAREEIEAMFYGPE